MGIGTFVALIPPILAIVLCLVSKEVNLSLAAGVVAGALLFTGFDPFSAANIVIEVGSSEVGDNFAIIAFLVLLGMMVALMNVSGASRRYADWATRKIKTKRTSLLATVALGVIIFMDDYFSCLTVGTVMRPITDTKKISREKLAYIIDSTAAPVCIIAPVSSWAAAVSSSLPEGSAIDGFQLFMQTIPANFYAIFSIIMVLIVIIGGFNMGMMKRDEAAAENGTYEYTELAEAEDETLGNGKIVDLVLPVIVLIFFCLLGMLYTGGLFEGVGIAQAFADCDAGTGLTIGALFSLVVTAIIYLPRRVITWRTFMECLLTGTKLMIQPILILFFAWTLSAICGEGYLDAGGFVSGLLSQESLALGFLPALFFLVGLGLAFATGTSWGTFAILLPIGVTVLGDSITPLMVICCAAILGGAVAGDHLSPISDTTIMSSTGAGCVHVKHVSTQLPYGLTVAAISVVCYLVSGFTQNYVLGLVLGLVLLAATYLIGRVTFAKPIQATPAEQS